MADQLVRWQGWEGGAYATRMRASCNGRLADDRPMSRLRMIASGDSSLNSNVAVSGVVHDTRAAINSNVKYAWPISLCQFHAGAGGCTSPSKSWL